MARDWTKSNWKYIVVSLIFFGTLAVPSIIYFLPTPAPIPAWKPICDIVHRDLQLECPTILGAEDVYSLGAAVHPLVTEFIPGQNEPGPIGLPISNLLSETCHVPGSARIIVRPEQKIIALSDIEYRVEKSLFGKASFSLPTFAGASVEPGANASKLSTIKLKIKKAWTKNLDANSLTQAISSCSIKLACLDNLKNFKYRVINNVVVAEGVKYDFFNSSNSEVAIGNAVNEGIVKIEADDVTKGKIENQNVVSSETPLVLAFGLLPNEFLANVPLCTSPIITQVSGSSSLFGSGGGGIGNIGGPLRDTATLGHAAGLSRQGSERSQCQDGFERTKSLVDGTAKVTAPTDASLRFESKLKASGGHYATAAACAAGTLIGKVGHDNTTSLTASMRGTIRVVVRSESASMFLRWNGMPENGTTLRVTDPSGLPLFPSTDKRIVNLSPDGTIKLPVEGLQPFPTVKSGVYLIETTVEIAQTANGAGQKQQDISAKLEVNFQ